MAAQWLAVDVRGREHPWRFVLSSHHGQPTRCLQDAGHSHDNTASCPRLPASYSTYVQYSN